MSAVPVTDLVLADRSPGPKWSGGAMAVAVDRVAAVDRLPGSDHQDPYQRLAMAFFVGCPANSSGPTSVTSKPGALGAQAPVRFAACAGSSLQSEATSFILATLPRTAEATRSSLAGAESEVVLLVKAPKSRYVSAAGRRA